MMLAVFASLLLAQPAEVPPPDLDVPEAAEPANGQGGPLITEDAIEEAAEATEDAVEAVEDAAEAAEEVADEATEAAEEVAEDAAEAVEDEVCRRRHTYNEWGRRVTRKVCRPRED